MFGKNCSDACNRFSEVRTNVLSCHLGKMEPHVPGLFIKRMRSDGC